MLVKLEKSSDVVHVKLASQDKFLKENYIYKETSSLIIKYLQVKLIVNYGTCHMSRLVTII